MATKSTVPTVANGDSWSAAQQNTYLRDNIEAVWPYTTAGDLAYASAANQLARLAFTSGGLLYGGASAPAWLANTAGGLLYGGASIPAWLAKSSSYRTLKMNSAGTYPEWAPFMEKCLLYNSGTINIPDSTTIALTWDSERVDDKGWHSTSSNTNRITVLETAFYIPSVAIHWVRASGGSGTFTFTTIIRQNGSDTPNRDTRLLEVDMNAKLFTVGGVPIAMNAGDYIDVTVNQNSGDYGTIYGSGAFQSNFSLVRIS